MRFSALTLRQLVMLGSLAAFAAMPFIVEILDTPFLIDFFIRLMIFAIAAVSLNLILGYGGMISFGHAAFIGIGAYAAGIPAYYGEYSGWVQLPLAMGASALYALVTGYVCLRTRGVYFIMITLAFAQMVFFAFVSLEEYGGDDGLVIEVRSRFPGLIDIENTLALYYLIFGCLVASLVIVHRIVHSRFGMVIRGAKGNDERMQAIGFNTFRYRLVCFMIAGAMCGLAGWLFANFSYFISPVVMSWTRSGELIFMVVLGGAGTLFGPVLGAIAFFVLEEVLSRFTLYWQIIFGPLLILIVLFARGGLDGILARLERSK